MRTVQWTIGLMLGCMALSVAIAQTTRPGSSSAEETLDKLLKPTGEQIKPLQSVPGLSGGVDATSGTGAVAPGAPIVNVMREGSSLVDRTGRLIRTETGNEWEFAFDSDGRALSDPPVLVLPNLNLMKMEQALTAQSRDLRFRITGEITEYRGRNYVLLRKAMVVPDAVKQF